MNNATAKWLAGYFDVVFAANRVLHPGEKRLVDFATNECGMLPARFDADVSTLLELATAMHPSIGPHVDEMVARLDSDVITAF